MLSNTEYAMRRKTIFIYIIIFFFVIKFVPTRAAEPAVNNSKLLLDQKISFGINKGETLATVLEYLPNACSFPVNVEICIKFNDQDKKIPENFSLPSGSYAIGEILTKLKSGPMPDLKWSVDENKKQIDLTYSTTPGVVNSLDNQLLEPIDKTLNTGSWLDWMLAQDNKTFYDFNRPLSFPSFFDKLDKTEVHLSLKKGTTYREILDEVALNSNSYWCAEIVSDASSKSRNFTRICFIPHH